MNTIQLLAFFMCIGFFDKVCMKRKREREEKTYNPRQKGIQQTRYLVFLKCILCERDSKVSCSMISVVRCSVCYCSVYHMGHSKRQKLYINVWCPHVYSLPNTCKYTTIIIESKYVFEQ